MITVTITLYFSFCQIFKRLFGVEFVFICMVQHKNANNYFSHHPAIHLEFCLPFGKKYINVTEADGNLEVCVRVASTGYYEQLMHPVYVDITFKSITASGIHLHV